MQAPTKPAGTEWEYVEDPDSDQWLESDRRLNKGAERSSDGQPKVDSPKIFSRQEHVPAKPA